MEVMFVFLSVNDVCGVHLVGWCSCNTLDLYSEGIRFESQSLIVAVVFLFFLLCPGDCWNNSVEMTASFQTHLLISFHPIRHCITSAVERMQLSDLRLNYGVALNLGKILDAKSGERSLQ